MLQFAWHTDQSQWDQWTLSSHCYTCMFYTVQPEMYMEPSSATASFRMPVSIQQVPTVTSNTRHSARSRTDQHLVKLLVQSCITYSTSHLLLAFHLVYTANAHTHTNLFWTEGDFSIFYFHIWAQIYSWYSNHQIYHGWNRWSKMPALPTEEGTHLLLLSDWILFQMSKSEKRETNIHWRNSSQIHRDDPREIKKRHISDRK